MFDPDLGYYARSLRSGRRLIIVAFVAGGVIGGVTAIGSSPSGGWKASQSIHVQKVAVSPVIGKIGFLNSQPLPDRKVATEAALLTDLISRSPLHSKVVVVGNDAGSSLDVTSTDAAQGTATADLASVIDRYVADRTADYDELLGATHDALVAVKSTAESSLEALDRQVSAAPESGAGTAALVAQRNEVAETVLTATAALDYLAGFRTSQTGGVAPVGDVVSARISVPRSTTAKSAAKRGVAFALVAAVLAAAWLLVRRTARRRIEDAADLSLYTSVVSLGDLGTLGSGILAHLDGTGGAPSSSLLVTQSLVGGRAAELVDALERLGLHGVFHPCLALPEISTFDRVVVAVDRGVDDERSIEDLLQFLRVRVTGPILAVLC